MKDRAILVVPHQDDEIDLAGNILGKLNKNFDLMVVYSSLDADEKKGKIRKAEAIQSCGVWGISSKQIVFLAFPDTVNSKGTHFYTNGDKRIVYDLVRLLKDKKPNFVFGTDFDSHSDHRMLCLALDDAVAKYVKETHEKIAYFKGFCYETAFYGPTDFKASRLTNSKVKHEPLSNPSFLWDDHISIPSNEKNGPIWKTKAFKGLSKHKSQYAILHAKSIINADNVFWMKRTDNLLFDAELKVTSGDVEKLRDLKILDTKDIITLDPRAINYDFACWKPNKADINPQIDIAFTHDQIVCEIVIHGNVGVSQKLNGNIYIELYDKENTMIASTSCAGLREYGRATTITINKKCRFIRIYIDSKEILDVGISEIEIFDKSNILSLPTELLCKEEVKTYSRIMDWYNDAGYWIIDKWTRVKRKCKKMMRLEI